MPPQKTWKPWHDRILKTLWKRGHNTRTAGAKMGFSATTVAKQVRRLELPTRSRGAKRGDNVRNANRDAEIYAAHCKGANVKRLVAQYRISLSRLYAIIRNEKHKVESGKVQQG